MPSNWTKLSKWKKFLSNGAKIYLFDQNACLLPLPNWYYLFLYGSGLTGKRTRSPSKIIKTEWTEYRTQGTCSFSKVFLSKQAFANRNLWLWIKAKVCSILSKSNKWEQVSVILLLLLLIYFSIFIHVLNLELNLKFVIVKKLR